ncbi:M56 family metallopeptidase [Pedobacter sp. Hv1]|uniref:M56 family metallopeptidase n=1 Tax=Pedobacter sp. Hv1 TaxID=1740090 RepID=UPI0006D89A2C|nr:M56 family metallopeptidase [Pedobacter sp. Hv1]KQB99582.1 hypothetical protein AQF98_18690 [Pedobacter sp. Hv1]
MIIYLAKFVLCSGLFLVTYLLLLDKEKAHRFKRLYLLASLFLALLIPLITIESKADILPVETIPHFNIEPVASASIGAAVAPVQEQTNYIPYLIWAVYIGISTILLFKFSRNIFMLLSKIKQSSKTNWNGVTVVLSEKPSVPYSFINCIFVDKMDYEHGQIAEEILQHELAHVQQKHSLDVIVIELLQLFFWFNPFLYFYRKAIQTNHEYLADEAVINTSHDISTYQLVLIQQVSKQSGLTLTSQFNYLTIKKRLMMMSKTNSMKKLITKQLLLLPIIGFAVMMFATQTIAQNKPSQSKIKQTATSKEGLTTAELAEFNTILAKYNIQKQPEHFVTFPKKLEKADDDRLFVLYNRLSAQQLKTFNAKIVHTKPLQANVPSSKQLTDWQNSKKYGVWIDDKRVDNTELAKYQPSDFKHWDSSNLTEKAINYGKHYFQVNLMTKAHYQTYLAEANKNKSVKVCFSKHDQAK